MSHVLFHKMKQDKKMENNIDIWGIMCYPNENGTLIFRTIGGSVRKILLF